MDVSHDRPRIVSPDTLRGDKAAVGPAEALGCLRRDGATEPQQSTVQMGLDGSEGTLHLPRDLLEQLLKGGALFPHGVVGDASDPGARIARRGRHPALGHPHQSRQRA